MKQVNITIALLTVCAGAALAAGTAPHFDFVVAPDGDDRHPGSLEKPFATLQRARDAVRARKAADDAPKHITVALRGGVYRPAQTVVFSLKDSAPENGSVTYGSYPGEQAVLDGSVEITGWSRWDDVPEILPDTARGHVWTAPLPDRVNATRVLYDESGFLPRARCDTFQIDPDRKPPPESRDLVYLKKAPFQHLMALPHMELFALSGHYAFDILPLASFDEETLTLRTAAPATHNLYWFLHHTPDMRKFKDFACYLENSIEFLDEPGEWVSDPENGRIYLWPRDDTKPAGIAAGRLTEIVRVEGDIDMDGPTDVPVKGLVFENLTFTRTDRMPWPEDGNLWSIWGASWEIADHPTCALRFRGAEDCRVAHCTFTRTGGGGARFDLHAQNNEFSDNTIHHVGGVGLFMCGYGLGTKNVNKRNTIRNNHIHHVGELDFDAYGILLYQSGENIVEHNLVHDTPYSGIGMVGLGPMAWRNDKGSNGASKLVRYHEITALIPDMKMYPTHGDMPESVHLGIWRRQHGQHTRDNVIRRNRIYDTMRKLGDGFAIEHFPSGPGNRIVENYLTGSIRCDTVSRHAVVERNLLVDGAIVSFLDNRIVNNFLVDGPYLVWPPFPKRVTYVSTAVRENPTLIERNVMIRNDQSFGEPLHNLDKFRKELEAEDLPTLVHMEANVYWSPQGKTEAFDRYLEDMQAAGLESNSRFADPGLIDPLNGDCRLRPDSPLAEMGIEGFDFRVCGPTAASAQRDE